MSPFCMRYSRRDPGGNVASVLSNWYFAHRPGRNFILPFWSSTEGVRRNGSYLPSATRGNCERVICRVYLRHIWLSPPRPLIEMSDFSHFSDHAYANPWPAHRRMQTEEPCLLASAGR